MLEMQGRIGIGNGTKLQGWFWYMLVATRGHQCWQHLFQIGHVVNDVILQSNYYVSTMGHKYILAKLDLINTTIIYLKDTFINLTGITFLCTENTIKKIQIWS